MNDDDLEKAARWHARLEDAPHGASSQAARAGFAAWYHARDDHRRAFTAVTNADSIARNLRAEPALQSLADQALSRANARNAWMPRWGLTGLVSVMVVGPVAALTIRQFATTETTASTRTAPIQVFKTAIGQQRVVRLDDATRVLLDTGSQLAVNGSILTVQGQAEVTAGRSSIEVLMSNARVTIQTGSFNVRVEDDRVELLAQDSEAVAVFASHSSLHSVVVKRGALLSVNDGVPSVTRASDPGAITGWQTGWLQFDDVPLARAVREVNRYRQRPIRLSGNADRLKISGSFRTGADDAFLDAVAATLPATIDQSVVPPTIIVRGPPK